MAAKGYSSEVKAEARSSHEIDGETLKSISEKMSIPLSTLLRWKREFKWTKTGNLEKVEATVMQARMELARKEGIGEVEQYKKAKELMSATKTVKVTVKDEDDNETTVEKEVPDWRIQNEGLKRAMELTGTKIERVEHDHKHDHDIRHLYEMPQRKAIDSSMKVESTFELIDDSEYPPPDA